MSTPECGLSTGFIRFVRSGRRSRSATVFVRVREPAGPHESQFVQRYSDSMLTGEALTVVTQIVQPPLASAPWIRS